MIKNFTCVGCDIKFMKEVLDEKTIVMCPICGKKQLFRYKIMDTDGERWEESDPWDDF